MSALHESNFTNQLYLVKGPGQLRVSSDHYSADKTEKIYAYYKKDNELVSFRARPLPGCCGVLVVYYVRPKEFKGKIFKRTSKEIFTQTIKAVLEAAKAGKYASVLMTLLVSSNEAEEVLEYAGFYASNGMRNAKTGNLLRVFTKDLEQPMSVDHEKFVVE